MFDRSIPWFSHSSIPKCNVFHHSSLFIPTFPWFFPMFHRFKRPWSPPFLGFSRFSRPVAVAQQGWDQLLKRGLDEGQGEAGEDDVGALIHEVAFLAWVFHVGVDPVDFLGVIPSGYVKIAIEHGHRHSEFSHEKWWIFP